MVSERQEDNGKAATKTAPINLSGHSEGGTNDEARGAATPGSPKTAWALERDARRRHLYHVERGAFLRKVHGVLIFSFIFFGSWVVLGISEAFNGVIVSKEVLGLIAFIAGAIDVVFLSLANHIPFSLTSDIISPCSK